MTTLAELDANIRLGMVVRLVAAGSQSFAIYVDEHFVGTVHMINTADLGTQPPMWQATFRGAGPFIGMDFGQAQFSSSGGEHLRLFWVKGMRTVLAGREPPGFGKWVHWTAEEMLGVT